MPDLLLSLTKISKSAKSDIGELCHSLIYNIFEILFQASENKSIDVKDSHYLSELIDFLERVLDKFSDLAFDVVEVTKHLFKNFEQVLISISTDKTNKN